MRIGYTVSRAGETATVVLPQVYTPAEAAQQVALAQAAEAGHNLCGGQAMRPPRPGGTVWFVVEDTAAG